MKVLKTDKVLFCDVDDTIIFWEPLQNSPYTVKIEMFGKTSKYYFAPHVLRHLQEHGRRGHGLVVWSKGGYEWAHAVTKALKLEEFFEKDKLVVLSKPEWLLDDKHPKLWLPNHVNPNPHLDADEEDEEGEE